MLYSTWVALPIDGCYKGLNLHHPLNHVTVAIPVTNAIAKITNHFLKCMLIFCHCLALDTNYFPIININTEISVYSLKLAKKRNRNRTKTWKGTEWRMDQKTDLKGQLIHD